MNQKKLLKIYYIKFDYMDNCPKYIIDIFDDIYDEEKYDSINTNYLDKKLNNKLEKDLKRYFNI